MSQNTPDINETFEIVPKFIVRIMIFGFTVHFLSKTVEISTFTQTYSETIGYTFLFLFCFLRMGVWLSERYPNWDSKIDKYGKIEGWIMGVGMANLIIWFPVRTIFFGLSEFHWLDFIGLAGSNLAAFIEGRNCD